MTDLIGVTRWTQEGYAPSVHECLEPPKARSFLIGEGRKGYHFDHHRERYSSVFVQGASWVQWSNSTWARRVAHKATDFLVVPNHLKLMTPHDRGALTGVTGPVDRSGSPS